MKTKLFVSTLLILSVTLFGCGVNSSALEHNTTIPANQPIVIQGESITVDGTNPNSSLNSVDFLDATTGWVVKNNYKAGSQNSYILETHDGGTSWQTTTVLLNTMVKQLKFVDQTTGWAIGQDASQINSNGQPSITKILYTQDGGQNWDVQWEGKENLSSDDKLCFQDQTRGYAMIGGTMLLTQNGGRQWSQVAFDVTGFIPQRMSFVSTDVGWVIGVIKQQDTAVPSEQNFTYKLVVLQTVDSGKHWQQQFTREYDKGEGPIDSVDIDFVNATTGWFLTSNMATRMGDLYYTSNAGQQWEKINQVGSARPTPTEIKFVTTEIGWISLDVGAGPIEGGLMYTKDGGKSFTKVNSDNEMDSAHEVDFISVQEGWVIGTALNYGDYLIHTKDGGQTWTQVYPKISPTKGISFVDDQHGFGLGQLSDFGALLYTADGGDRWQSIYSFGKQYRPSMVSFLNSHMGWILATQINTNKNVMLQTTDGGYSWTISEGDVPQIPIFNTSFFRFFDPENGIIVAPEASDINVYRTKDGGKTWYDSIQDHSDKDFYQFSFISSETGWEIFEVRKDHQFPAVLMHMTDGAIWHEIGQISANALPCGLDFISKDKGYMLINEQPFMPGSYLKLLATTDGGRTWTSHLFPNGFQLETQSSQMPIHFTDNQNGWILSNQGLLRTLDGGKTWSWE